MKYVIVSLVAVVILVGGFIVFAGEEADSPTLQSSTDQSTTTQQQGVEEEAAKEDSSIPATVIGDENAPVTIVEYSDYQCSICKAFHESAYKDITEQYVKTGKAKIEVRYLPFIGPESERAAEAATCAAAQGSFANYHNALYDNQGDYNSGTFNDNFLQQLAGDIGLDQNKFNLCLGSDTYAQFVDDSLQAAANRNVRSTPTFFIGDQQLVGNQPFTIFKAIIDGQS